MSFTFPKGFLWGAGTSAYQVEGGNKHSDWWAFEHSFRRTEELRKKGRNPEDFTCGDAVDFWNRFDGDFELAAHLGQNATRISLEWSRIEPNEGDWDEAALDRYERMLQSARFHGLKTFVTLHHFTLPRWFSERGGFATRANVPLFVKFAKRAAERLHQYADYWITVNEPEVYAWLSYGTGSFPPNHRSLLEVKRVADNLAAVHRELCPFFREHLRQPVGVAHHLESIAAASPLSAPVAAAARWLNRYCLRAMAPWEDFLGVNYYYRTRVGWFGSRDETSKIGVSDTGRSICPEGLTEVLLELKAYRKPIAVTENGLADARDDRRERFIVEHVAALHRAVARGVDVRAYLYWALLDNFEWADGWAPKFGLASVEREHLFRRRVRPSALRYAEICRSNALTR